MCGFNSVVFFVWLGIFIFVCWNLSGIFVLYYDMIRERESKIDLKKKLIMDLGGGVNNVIKDEFI